MTARSEELASNLARVEERISRAADAAGRHRSEITLIAVTKFFQASDAQILYDLGVRNFGENRDSEGAEKSPALPSDAIWHFQGQIQSRKIPSILSWADLIHSLDSIDHAKKISRNLEQSERAIDLFIQVNLESERADRGGVAVGELLNFKRELSLIPRLHIRGLMSVLPIEMAPAEGFALMAELRLKSGVADLSIGMSGDFEEAIASGATHIRVGSSILGSRPTLT